MHIHVISTAFIVWVVNYILYRQLKIHINHHIITHIYDDIHVCIYIYTRIHISVYIVKFTYYCMYPITWQCYYYMMIYIYIYISKYVVIHRLHLGLCRVCTLHFDARNLQDSGDCLSGYQPLSQLPGAERWGVSQSPATESTEKLIDVYE